LGTNCLDTSAPVPTSALVPKCLGTKVSGYHIFTAYCQTLWFSRVSRITISVSVRIRLGLLSLVYPITTRRPASADSTARHQFQVTGQPVSRTQASDAMTPQLPRYRVKCVQRRYFQWGSVPLRSDIKGTVLPPANILIPLERQLIALQLCR